MDKKMTDNSYQYRRSLILTFESSSIPFRISQKIHVNSLCFNVIHAFPQQNRLSFDNQQQRKSMYKHRLRLPVQPMGA